MKTNVKEHSLFGICMLPLPVLVFKCIHVNGLEVFPIKNIITLLLISYTATNSDLGSFIDSSTMHSLKIDNRPSIVN